MGGFGKAKTHIYVYLLGTIMLDNGYHMMATTILTYEIMHLK